MNIVVDDTDTSLTYSGQWDLFAGGSSRQWESTVHSTFQYGATVSFRFRGSVCKVYGTVPLGNGSTILMDVTIDGSVSPIISVASGSAAVYANLFYQSSPMESIWHTVIITNRGKAGNLDFEFDRVELDANDILPTVAAISLASTAAPASPSPQTSPSPSPSPSPSSTSSTSGGASSNSQLSTGKTLAQSTTVPFKSVLTQFVTTTRQDGSVSTSEVTLFPTAALQASSTPGVTTLFPTAASQSSSNLPHPLSVGTIIGIVGGIVAILIFLLFLFLYRRQRKAINHRFAIMGLGSNDVTQNMSQNPTTAATPFTLPPLHSMSEKGLRHHTLANRLETDLQASSIPPDLSPSSIVPPLSLSVPYTFFSSESKLNIEALTQLGLTLLSEPSDSSSPTGPQGPPEPYQAAANKNAAYRMRYLSGSSPPAYTDPTMNNR